MNNMTLEEAMDWAAGYNPSSFQRAGGEVAEFAGALHTVNPIVNKVLPLGPKASVLQKATKSAYSFGTVSTVDQLSKQVSEKVDPTDTDYGYEGPSAAIRDATIGFIFSLAGQGAKAAWKAARPTEQARALARLGLKKGATEAEIKTASRYYSRQYHPDKVKGMESEWKQFRKDLKTVAAGEEKDIVYRGANIKVKGPKLITGDIKKASKEGLAAVKPEPVISDGVELTPGQEQAGIVVAGNKIYQGDKLLFQATTPITPERVAQIARIHKIDVTEPTTSLPSAETQPWEMTLQEYKTQGPQGIPLAGRSPEDISLLNDTKTNPEKYLFHATANASDAINIEEEGLVAGGLSGKPESGYAQSSEGLILVFDRASFPQEGSLGDVSLLSKEEYPEPIKPIGVFKQSEYGGHIEFNARMQELGDQPENPVDLHHGIVKQALAEGKPVPAEVLAEYPELQPTPQPATPEIAKPKPVRFEEGKKLTKEEKKSVLKSVGDAYKDNQAPRVVKYITKDGEEVMGYAYSPESMYISDITGKKIRHYVFLPDGRKAHPTELFPNMTKAEVDRAVGEAEILEKQTEFRKQELLKFASDADSLAEANRLAIKRNLHKSPQFDQSVVLKKGDQFVRVVSDSDIDLLKSEGFVEAIRAGKAVEEAEIEPPEPTPAPATPDMPITEPDVATADPETLPIPPKFRKGTAQVPSTVEDIAALTKYTVQTAGKYISDFGEGGTKLVDSVVKADEHATMRAGRANEEMHDAIKGLTKAERKSFGKAVNGIMYERLPKHIQDSDKWKNASDVWMEPISENQRAAAEKYLEIADAALEEAGQLGFERQFIGGGKAVTEGGGIPWPQRLNKKGEKAMEKALRAMTGDNELDIDILKKNDLVNTMIERGLADGPADAWKKLQIHREHMKRLKYGMFEGSKIQLPEEYVKLDSHDVLGQPYWKNMFMQVEMAKNLGGADYPDAAKNIAKIKAEFGEGGANEAQQWLDRINGVDRLGMTGAQRAAERFWGDMSAFQTIKLGPATSMQNWFQTLIQLTEHDPRDVFKGLVEAYVPKFRKKARQSGAIPHDPFESSIAADFADAESGTFMKKIARAWSWSIGMSATERGNNYKAAIIAAHGMTRDLQKLSQSNTKLGQLVRNIVSLGGDSPGAIKRRLEKHGIDWEKAMDRGYLTKDELAIASQRGSKRTNFRSDLFTTPLWWQKSPWMRAMSKYKIPFAYNYTNKMWEAASEALKHGNMRPALAFLAVTTATGEIYNYLFREKVLGESREDQSAAKRIWEDLQAGAGLGIFGALMFGYDARSTLWNFVGGPIAKTIDNILRTYQDIQEAPEHTRDHLTKLYEREFPVGKYINQIRNRPQHQADVARWKIRELWPDKDSEKFFYGDDMYDAIRFDDFTGAMSALHNLKRLGADKGAVLSALTAKRPVKVKAEDRKEWEETLTGKQKALVASEESAHQITLAKAKSLLSLSEVDPDVTDFYIKLDNARAKATQAKIDGLEPKEVLSIEDLTTIAIYNRISPRLTMYEQQILEATTDAERKEIYNSMKDLYEVATEAIQ